MKRGIDGKAKVADIHQQSSGDGKQRMTEDTYCSNITVVKRIYEKSGHVVDILRWIVHQSEFGVSPCDRSAEVDPAILDCILRSFCAAVDELHDDECRSMFCLRRPGQCIVPRSTIIFTRGDGECEGEGDNYVNLHFACSRIASVSSEGDLDKLERTGPETPTTCPIPRETLLGVAIGSVSRAREALPTALKAQINRIALRKCVAESGAIGFVANGSILPRVSGGSDKPPPRKGSTSEGEASGVVPFMSPTSLEVSFTLPFEIPGNSAVVKGMLIKEGVTVIAGGGFQGKTTLLRALASGHLDRVDGDGREFAVTATNLSTLRAEDGRHVSSVDISAFIADLPAASGLDSAQFSTANASGSTSQAAAVVEGLEVGVKGFLVDEDTSAVNFMIRDSRMRSLIDRETITPFIYRVSNLHAQKGVSSVVVVGGSGDWFDVQTQTLLLENYTCEDATSRAKRISKAFCSGHIQFNGQGLVHQLKWPGVATSSPVPVIATMEEGKGVKVRFLDVRCLRITRSFRVSNDGRTIFFYHQDNPDRTQALHDEGKSLALGSRTSDPVAELDLSRVDAFAAGEQFAAAVGIAVSLSLLHRHLCDGGDEDRGGKSMESVPWEKHLSYRSKNNGTNGTSSDRSTGCVGAERDSGRWVRLELLLDMLQDLRVGNSVWGHLDALDPSVLLVVSQGFLVPDRLLMAKVLNRLPGADFAITNGRGHEQ